MSAVDVTVVVPVYNPGESIEPGIASLLAQSLPAERFEVIFVDDGSTDGVSDRLDRLATEHDHFRVIHQPNSGWPGKPRNVGVDAATGTFVQFLDQDDVLGPMALELLHRFGVANDSDIVIGKVTSDFPVFPRELFRRNVARCSIRTEPLIHSLTPHKMFRRQFLLDHNIRHLEGRRRLEDQQFMVECYFATDAVSILCDYPCYYYLRRADGGNNVGGHDAPAGYYGNLRDVLAVVEANTEPGEFRNSLLARFAGDQVRRITMFATSDLPTDYVQGMYREIRALCLDWLPAEVVELLPPGRRRVIEAVVDDRYDRVVQLAQLARDVKAVAKPWLGSVRWSGGSWVADLSVELVDDNGSPFVVRRSTEGWTLDERLSLSDEPPLSMTTAQIIDSARCDVVVQDRASLVEWFVPGQIVPALEPVPGRSDGAHHIVFRGTAALSPSLPFGTERLAEGSWNVSVRVRAVGLGRRARLGPDRADGIEPLPALLRPQPTLATPRLGAEGKLTLVVRRVASVSRVLARHICAVALDGDSLVAAAPLRLVGGSVPIEATVIVSNDDGVLATWPAAIGSTEAGAELRCEPGRDRLPQGQWPISVQVKATEQPQPFGVLTIGRRGRASSIITV